MASWFRRVWSTMVPLLLAKRESFARPLDNEPWERKLARTFTVVGPDGFPSSNKLFHPHIYLGPGPFSLKLIYWVLGSPPELTFILPQYICTYIYIFLTLIYAWKKISKNTGYIYIYIYMWRPII